MRIVREKLLSGYVKVAFAVNDVKQKIKDLISDERGEGVVAMIIFTALIILAVLATQPTIRSAFDDATTKFRTWLNDKLDTLFA